MSRNRVIKRKELSNHLQVRTTKIQATQRMAIKIRDNYYTIEYLEEREIPNNPNIDLEQEKLDLFESVKNTVYGQMEEIIRGLNWQTSSIVLYYIYSEGFWHLPTLSPFAIELKVDWVCVRYSIKSYSINKAKTHDFDTHTIKIVGLSLSQERN